MLTATPIFVKDSLIKEVETYVEIRKKLGYEVKSKMMFFSSMYGSKPKEVKVMVSAVKNDPHSIVSFVYILRRDGTWK